MRTVYAVLLLLSLFSVVPSVMAGSSTTEFFLHAGECSGYPMPCIVLNENSTLNGLPTSYTMNQSSPILFVGLMPTKSPTGLRLNAGSYFLHLFVSTFTIDPLIDPAYVKISLARSTGMVANGTFFNPSFGENTFNFSDVPASTGTPYLTLTLNTTGSSITKISFQFDSPDQPSRLSTTGFQYLAVPTLTPVAVIALALSLVLVSMRRRRRSMSSRATPAASNN